MIFDQLANSRCAVDMRHDLKQEVGSEERSFDSREIGRTMLVAHGARCYAHRAVIQRAHQRVDFGTKRRVGKLLGKSPELPSAGDRRVIIEKHAVAVTALATTERNRDDLAAFGVVPKASRIRHADELELDQRLLEFQRLRHESVQFFGIGTIGDDEIFAMDKAVRTDRIGWARQRHCEGPPPYLAFSNSSLAKATAIEVPSSHVAMLSFPKEVADLIIKAAE